MKILLGLFTYLLCGSAIAQNTKIYFADADTGQRILSTPDDFTRGMSAFDRQARAQVAEPPSPEEFLKFAGKAAIDWPEKEQRALQASWDKVVPKMAALGAVLPEGKITMIRTNGKEDIGVAYTRGTSIIFHPDFIAAAKDLDALLAHELFHIISRANPKLRDQLYAIIGFTPCGEIAFPKSLAARKISNPDAPYNQHSITLKIGGKDRPALPVLVASRRFDVDRKEDMFSYVMLQFLVVEKKADHWVAAELKDGSPHLVAPIRIGNFSEQIGKNTNYIIHPEEILADNFKFLVLGKKGLPNPEIIEKMRAIFAATKTDS